MWRLNLSQNDSPQNCEISNQRQKDSSQNCGISNRPKIDSSQNCGDSICRKKIVRKSVGFQISDKPKKEVKVLINTTKKDSLKKTPDRFLKSVRCNIVKE